MGTLGNRLTTLLKKHQIKSCDLAKQLGISKQTISLICHEKIRNPRKIHEIAELLGVSYNWLLFGDHEETPEENNYGLVLNKYHKIPLITSLNISKNYLIDNKLHIEITNNNFELTSDPDYQSLFAMRGENNAMQLRFGSTPTLIFHTNLEPRSGDFVICYLPDKDLFVYRDLEIKNNKKILVPLDPHIYNKLIVRKQDIIVAVLHELRQKRGPHGFLPAS